MPHLVTLLLAHAFFYAMHFFSGTLSRHFAMLVSGIMPETAACRHRQSVHDRELTPTSVVLVPTQATLQRAPTTFRKREGEREGGRNGGDLFGTALNAISLQFVLPRSGTTPASATTPAIGLTKLIYTQQR